MKNIWTIFKKDMRRFFTDRRMLAALFLPGIITFLVYTIMGRYIMPSLASTSVTNVTYDVAYTTNSGAEKPQILTGFEAYLASSEEEKTNRCAFYPVEIQAEGKAKTDVVEGKYDVLIVFSDNFEANLKTSSGSPLDNRIVLYYNGAEAKGTHAYTILNSLANSVYRNYLVNVDAQGQAITANLSSKDYVGSKIFSSIIPLIASMMLFSTVASICPDAVAGEKERGTLSVDGRQ